MSHPELPAGVYRRLVANLQGEVRVDHPTRALYSTDASIYQIFPLAVVYPKSVADLEAVVALANESTPLIVRGGGSGLAGETLGEAIIADCSKYLTKVEDISADAGTVRVEGGLVLERLNRQLAPMNMQFGPDPGSATRCTIGGMVANNAAGMHSLLNGTTRDNIVSLDLVLSDGSHLEVGPSAALPRPNTLAARIHAEMSSLLEKHAALIESKTPRHLKRHRAGYLLHDVLLDVKAGEGARLDLAKLICGSEGTLAAIASATLRIVPRLKHTGVGLFSFAEVAAAGEAVPLILAYEPSAVEMLDHTILRMARETGRLPADLVPAEAKSTLLVEFAGESTSDIAAQLEAVEKDLRANTPVLRQIVIARSPAERERIWAVRSSGEPLLNRRPGHRHAITVVEDIAVSPLRLGEYVRGLDRIFGKHDVEFAAYGHAGVGVLHVRPYFDFRDGDDLRKIRECADEVYDFALGMGGSISGEHGDGLVRTSYLPKQYGELYPVFGEVKRIFDPKGILNPDKIWRATQRNSLLENLRTRTDRPYRNRKARTIWEEGHFEKELDRCNGCGECKGQNRALVMCPLYKDGLDEAASPRGKANLIRSLMNGVLGDEFFGHPDVKRITHACVNCKGCHVECPLSTDVARLMLEAKAEYVARNGQSLPNLMLALSEYTSLLSALAAPIANPMMRFGVVRRIMETFLHIDARRPMPRFAFTPLSRFRAACPHPAKPVARVALFLDLYARYNDSSLTLDFLKILAANDVEVIVPPQHASGLPAMSYASMGVARAAIHANARAFSQAIDDGYTVVTTESSAALALREEALAFSGDSLVRKLAENTLDAMTFLAKLKADGCLRTSGLAEVDMRVGHHVPCHVKALGAQNATREVLGIIPGLEVRAINEGCCGIAGTWGMKHENYEKSMTIGAPLFEALRDMGIECGVSECSTCRMQMEHGSGKQALHPITLLARAYRD